MKRARIVAVPTAVLAAACALTACSSSGGGGTPPVTSQPPAASAPASGTPTATVTAGVQPADTTVTAGPTDAADAPSGGAGGLTQCAESQLRANATADDIAGLDRHVVRLTFTNTSSSACTLTGFPGAAIEDSSDKQVQQAKRVVGGPVGGTIEKSSTLTLRAAGTAYAYLEGASTREQGAAQAGCDAPKYPRILVTPPNTTVPVPFTVGWPQCYSFDVHPVRLG